MYNFIIVEQTENRTNFLPLRLNVLKNVTYCWYVQRMELIISYSEKTFLLKDVK